MSNIKILVITQVFLSFGCIRICQISSPCTSINPLTFSVNNSVKLSKPRFRIQNTLFYNFKSIEVNITVTSKKSATSSSLLIYLLLSENCLVLLIVT